MSTTFWARTDSGSANNPALNLTGDPAQEITFVASGTNGDWTLEQPVGGGVDPDTQVEIDGVQYEFTFELSGTMPTQNRHGAQQVPDQFEGEVVYLITVQDYPVPGETTRLAFMPDANATQADMDAFRNGSTNVQKIAEPPDPAPICFAENTSILTASGAKPVEELRVGDLLVTFDHGLQPLKWVSSSQHHWPGSDEKHLPILIRVGAFGLGQPQRDLIVSPQHKFLVYGPGIDPSGMLAPAKGLIGMPGVRVMKGRKQVRYFHLMLDRHAILNSEGVLSESFYPGDTALQMLGRKKRIGLLLAFPEKAAGFPRTYGEKARPSLTVTQTRRLVATGALKKVAIAPIEGVEQAITDPSLVRVFR